MKKTVAISLLVCSFLFANDEYNVFVGSFSDDVKEEAIESARASVERKVGDFEDVEKVVSGTYGKYRAIAVKTKSLDKEGIKNLIDKIKAAGYTDAYSTIAKDEIGKNDDESGNLSDKNSASEAPKPGLRKKQDLFFKEAPEPMGVKYLENSAQEGGQVSLNEAVKNLLLENPGLKETEFAYMQVGKDLNIANNAYYPTFDIGGSYGYRKEKINNGITVQKGDGKKFAANATLTENLYNGGADKNRMISQSYRMDAAAYSVAQKADRLTLEFANAYLGVLQTKELLDIAKSNVKIHEEIYSQIKDRTSSGFARGSEERQAGSRLTLAQANLISRENNYNDALSTFEKLYGKGLAAENLIAPSFELPLPGSESAVYNIAMRCNPAVLLQDANIKMNQSVVNEKNAAFRPRVDLEASANHEKNDVFYDNYKDTSYDVLLRVKYNLYNKNADKLEKEKAVLAVTESSHGLERVKRDLSESLKFSWQTYVLNQKRLGYLNEHVKYARETLDAYRDEFRIGRRDLINLLDAESEYNNALVEIVNTQKELLYAKFRLLDNMGMITDSFEPGFAKKYIQGACSIAEDLR